MAVRKLKPVTPGQPCQRSLSFTVSVLLVVETTPVR